jgi:chitinase
MGPAGVDVCGNSNVVAGVFDFWGLIDGGFLTADGTAANGIDYVFDRCSQTGSHQKESSKSVSSID